MSVIPPLFRFLARYVFAVWLCSVMAHAATVDTTFTFSGKNTKCIAVQPDGRAVVAYDNYNGGGGRLLARLNTDGSKDPLFSATVDGVIQCIAVQADGKILIGGNFYRVSGISRSNFARLLPDGSVDPTFDPRVDFRVSKIVVQADGRILFGGNFYKVDGQPRNNIARVSADGVLDETFAPILHDECSAIHVQADGRILVGSVFYDDEYNRQSGVARYSDDGVRDETFAPTLNPYRVVTWIAEQPDGKILMILSLMSMEPIMSSFQRVDATTGATDATYQNNLPSGATIYAACMQTDGRVVIAGAFTRNSTNYVLARLGINGQFDPTVGVGPSGYFLPVHTIAPTANGGLLVGGDFTRILNTNRAGIARLSIDSVATSLVAPDLTSVEWQRSATTPMLNRVTFESRTGNSEWSFLGHGQWSNGKWRLDNTTLPANGAIRARGFLSAPVNTSVYQDYLSIGDTQPQLTIEQGGAVFPPDGTLNAGNLLSQLKWEYDFKLTNTGDRKLEQLAISQFTGISNPGTLPVTLQPGESTVIRASVLTSQLGAVDSSFTVTSNAVDHPSYTVRITGTSTNVISPVFNSPTDVPAPGGGVLLGSHTFGQLTLGFAPEPGTVLTVIKGLTSTRRLANLPDGSIVTADFGGVTYQFLAGQQNSPYSLTLTLLGGDGVLSKKHNATSTSTSAPLAVEDDGAFHLGLNRWDAAEQNDPVFRTSLSLGSPKYLTLVNGDIYHATDTDLPSPQLVRLRNDGSTDLTFSAPINGHVRAMAALPDNRIIIGGAFTTVSGVARPALARLHPDGSVDAGFVPQIDLTGNSVTTLAAQADGKILIGTLNPMTLPGGTSSNVVRFLPDGAVDATFSLTTEWVNLLVVQPDGKILRLADNGVSSSRSIQRFHPDGSVDSGFFAPTDGAVTDVALLADGKLLICGYFTRIGEHLCSGIARLHPDGSPDLTFFARTATRPSGILVSGKNELFISGYFEGASGVSVPALAELNNPTASTQVEQVNANTIRWIRRGGAAELHWVKAELIPQGGAPVFLGLAQRIPGGWEISSPTPISNATVRLYGPAIHSDGMTVMAKELLEVGTVSPALAVTRDEQVLSTTVVHDLGTSMTGFEQTTTLRIRNDGAGTLRAPTVTIEGTYAAEFSLVQSSPTDLASGERRSFLLKFRPRGGGVRTAQLVIRGSNPSVPAHVVPVSMNGMDTLNPVFTNVTDVPLTEPGFDATPLNLGSLTLTFTPVPRTILKLVSNTSTSPITGTLADHPNQSYVTAVHNGITYTFLVNYAGGDGNDLTLRLVGVGDTVPGFAPAANGTGSGLAIQPDGKVLVGGNFTTMGGVPNQLLARLHPDGRADLSFSAALSNRTDSMVIQDDGRILIGGVFNTVNGVSRRGIARLEPDGTLDTSFDLRAANGIKTRVDTNRLLKLKSGKVLIGGQFTSLSDVPKQNIARLNADGSLDETFTTTIGGTTPDTAFIYSMYEQPDGKLLIGGRFTSVNGVPRFGFARLNEDGTLDTSFADLEIGPNPGPVPSGSETRVSAIVWQPDGKILFGGEFTSVLGQTRTRFARLNTDGSLDTTFSPSANNTVSSLALQEDGRILAAGLYTQISGQTRTRVARLNADGSLDPEFQPEVDGTVSTLVMDRHGKVWITGEFTTVSGLPTRSISKLENNGPGLSLSIENGTTALWSAGASAPALREVKFELSTDGGVVWSPLGAGTKVSGGWSITGLALPANGYLRAKGKAIGGNRGFSAIEDVVLFGRQPTKIEEWRMEQFGSLTNQRSGADLADADNDGVKNLMEYAFNLDPMDTTSAQVPVWTNDSSQFEISFTPPPTVEGVAYGAEWSSTMDPADWHEVTNQASGGEHRYVVPQDTTPLKFMRVKVTNTSGAP